MSCQNGLANSDDKVTVRLLKHSFFLLKGERNLSIRRVLELLKKREDFLVYGDLFIIKRQ